MRQALVLMVWLALASLARAQVFEFDLDEEEMVFFGQEGVPQPGALPGQAAAPQSARAKKLATLKFDRRPSAILAARSKGAPPKEGETAAAPATEGGLEGEIVMNDPKGIVRVISVGPGTAVSVSAVPAVPAAVAAPVVSGTLVPTEEVAAPEGEAEAAEAEPSAEDAAKAAEAAAKAAAETQLIEAEATAFQRHVTLGEWDAVKEYLAGLEEADAKAGYQRLLASLAEGPPKPQSPFVAYAEKNFFAPADLIGLLAAARAALEKKDLENLGNLVRQCVDSGSLPQQSLAELGDALRSGALPTKGTELAAILLAAGYPVEAGEFLPALEEARTGDDRWALNLLARHYLARSEKEPKEGWLEKAWEALQGVLATGTVGDEDKKEALQRAVEIAPRIRDELGETWLEESFTARPERGIEILAVIGAGSSAGLVDHARDSDYRLRSLELQTSAAEALLAAAPERAVEWADTLTLLAGNWLKEAQYTYQFDQSTSRGPSIQRDVYGNIFYMDYGRGMRGNPNMPLAIPTKDVLDQRPSDAWLAEVAVALRPSVEATLARLLLKVGAEAESFPFIERLARAHPDAAEDLVAEFLRVWIKNHNPNEENQRTNPYMFVYGFEERANGIPLTRSKQERNLVELADWIARLRQLPIDHLDEQLVANAFTAAHSSAEVYRVETIERVFGPLGDVEPRTLAELVQTMRANLVGVWRKPSTQEDKKTRRRARDIQQEILGGYATALAVLERALADHPDDWALVLARASVLHDENNYRQELEPSPEFSGRRQAALAEFARAAELYQAELPGLEQKEESTRVHELWFYAALGACDLSAIDAEQQPAPAQFELVRRALEALPGEAGARHRDMFANALVTRMGNVAPAVKYRYVRHGLEIVPGNERARDAQEIADYYGDLVTEIRLDARVDGDARVGQEPFGLYVDLRHTKDIERESGGFGKYLVNQNAQGFSWNYGRPTENYRDKFEEAAREALQEHFEVLSVTFNHPEANSRALAEYGWRVTPYAFLLLKARGPEVDRVPPLRLDLDFLDTSGYAILPVESAPLPIDARVAPEGRPFEALEVVQTLDERQAAEGKLVLEVQARARGLVPELANVLELATPGFEVRETDDQGVSVTEFDQEGQGDQVRSQRTWLLTLAAREGEEPPAEFHFGTARTEDAKLEQRRFVDADLATVDPVVTLEQRYGADGGRGWLGWSVGALAAVGLGLAGWRWARRAPGPGQHARFSVPENVSAFTVLGLLRRIEAEDGLSPGEKDELRTSIDGLERRYFAEQGGEEEELEELAQRWVGRTR